MPGLMKDNRFAGTCAISEHEGPLPCLLTSCIRSKSCNYDAFNAGAVSETDADAFANDMYSCPFAEEPGETLENLYGLDGGPRRGSRAFPNFSFSSEEEDDGDASIESVSTQASFPGLLGRTRKSHANEIQVFASSIGNVPRSDIDGSVSMIFDAKTPTKSTVCGNIDGDARACAQSALQYFHSRQRQIASRKLIVVP